MALIGKQKRVLRGLGQRLEADVTVGKAGTTEPLVNEVKRLLSGRELIKVRFPAISPSGRHALAAALADSCGAEVVAEVGHTSLFYRPNDGLDPSKRVILER